MESIICEPGRYHVYTGNPCPWCHRVVLALFLLGLTNTDNDHISNDNYNIINTTTTNIVDWTVLEDNPKKARRGGWIFAMNRPDLQYNCTDLHQLYNTLQPNYQGRCTAPLLIDQNNHQIISNESAEIVRILNHIAMHTQPITTTTTSTISVASPPVLNNLVPDELRFCIDATNEWVYTLLNNGVYRCGFATSQEAYDTAAHDVRYGLQQCATLLLQHNYLCGNQLTEADIRLLPTLLRYDGVYAPLFRAGAGTHDRIQNYPPLHQYLQRCWDIPQVRHSIDISDACASYYRQLFPLNPSGIIPTSVTAEGIGLVEPKKEKGRTN